MTGVTIVEFLLARIAEDETAARGVPDGQEYHVDSRDSDGSPWLAAQHYGRHDPARVLAKSEAERRIVALHHPSPEYDRLACVLCQWDVDCDAPKHDHQFNDGEFLGWPCETLRLLALPYADHPDYDEAWRP